MIFQENTILFKQHFLRETFQFVLRRITECKVYNVKNFFARNKQIAIYSDIVVGFIPKGIESNGTVSTINYAKKFDKKVIIID